MTNKLLVVIDMQHDFIDGSLQSQEAIAIVPKVVEKIKGWDGDLIATLDTHGADYLDTNEGKHLPVTHCQVGTQGHEWPAEIAAAFDEKDRQPLVIVKHTFGSTSLPEKILSNQYDYVEFIGLCTDICVVSNVLLTKAFCPEIDIVVDASCCAGVTPESHKAALTTMKMCQIEVIGEANA